MARLEIVTNHFAYGRSQNAKWLVGQPAILSVSSYLFRLICFISSNSASAALIISWVDPTCSNRTRFHVDVLLFCFALRIFEGRGARMAMGDP